MEEKLHSMRYQLVKKLRREPSAEELAEVLDVSTEEVERMFRTERVLNITTILSSTHKATGWVANKK